MKDKILVIDDERQVRSLLRRTLEHLGLDVIEAEDGDQAAQLAEREQPSLILLDMHMPRVDGITTLDAIRALDSSITVVVVTGDADWERVRIAMEHGASEYITKPLDLEGLELSVTSNLERRKARQAAARSKESRESPR